MRRAVSGKSASRPSSILGNRTRRPRARTIGGFGSTGWRKSEVLGLRWDWIDGEEIRIPDSKNGEGRSVPIEADLREIIERCRRARTFMTKAGVAISPFVFHRKGKPIFVTVFDKQFRAARNAAGLSGRIFHDLRRTAGRNMVRGGCSETVARSITGHKTRSMFDRYNISDDRDKRRALKGASAYAENNPGESSVVTSIAERLNTHSSGENTDSSVGKGQ
jgi:integrase